MWSESQRLPRLKSVGFTLVELMVVIAIMSILVGLIATIYSASKTRAFVTVDISNLRQMGVAGAIYASNHDDRFPLNVRPLYQEGLVPASICLSPLDHTTGGLATRFVSVMALKEKTEWEPLVPTTYIGPRDGGWTWESFSAQVIENRNPGWLVNLVLAKRSSPNSYEPGLGPYYRLMMDGSVKLRTAGYGSEIIEGIVETKVIRFKWYFCDE